MNCDDCQQLVCEALDSGVNPEANHELEQHLLACSACRVFRDNWVLLDDRLERDLRSASLPAGFKAALLEQLPALPPRLSPAEMACRRAELEREYNDLIMALQRRYLVPQALRVVRLLAMAFGCVVAGVLFGELVRQGPVAVDAIANRATTAVMIQLVGCLAALAVLLRASSPVWRSALQSLAHLGVISSVLARRS